MTYERVREVYGRCFRPENTKHQSTQVTAWLLRHTFSDKMLTLCREDIIRMLLCLPKGFRMDEKRGGSVSMMTFRDDGTMWTGDMSDIEKLVALGMAIRLVEFCAPRDKWHRLQGGLPYVRVMITRFGVSVQ